MCEVTFEQIDRLRSSRPVTPVTQYIYTCNISIREKVNGFQFIIIVDVNFIIYM